MNTFVRILLLTPTAFPSTTGNAITVERWRRSLIRQGYAIEVLATEDLEILALQQRVSYFRPDLIHVHHAFRTGHLLFNPSIEPLISERPLIVSPGGTDIHLDARTESRRRIITQIFEKAKAIITQSEEMGQNVLRYCPGLQDKIVMIPKSFCWMGEEVFNLREAMDCGPEDILFFFPAGVRPVKGNLETLLLLERAFSLRPSIRAAFVGSALDSEYSARFEQEIGRLRPFARWLPPIPPQAMRSAYHGADVVLNGSFSEGLSNVLLEARAAGKPILASDIPANRWPVLGGEGSSPAGILFDPHSPEDFLRKALRLVEDGELRRKLGRGGIAQANRSPDPDEEARGLIRVYKKALQRPSIYYPSWEVSSRSREINTREIKKD